MSWYLATDSERIVGQQLIGLTAQTLATDELAETATEVGRERVLETNAIALLTARVDDGELDAFGQRQTLVVRLKCGKKRQVVAASGVETVRVELNAPLDAVRLVDQDAARNQSVAHRLLSSRAESP